ncbi:uncharacterized mitochondrial protein-like protein [Tanacetum coccineum]
MDQDSAHIVAASKVPMLKPGEYEIWRMRIEQYIQRILCTWESHRECWQLAINKFGRSYDRDAYYIWNKADLDTMSMDDLYNNLKVYEPEVKGMSSSSSSTQNMAFGVQSSKKSRQQEQQNKSQEGLPRRTSTSTALVSCDGLGWICLEWIMQRRAYCDALMAFLIFAILTQRFKTNNCLSKGKAAQSLLFTWVFFLDSKDETSGILKSFLTRIENLIDHKVKLIRCDNGTEFKNRDMNQFCKMKGILRQFSVARTPQQNGVAERRNMTLIEAAKTMLADSKLPTTFWPEAVSTACYVTDIHKKTKTRQKPDKTENEIRKSVKNQSRRRMHLSGSTQPKLMGQDDKPKRDGLIVCLLACRIALNSPCLSKDKEGACNAFEKLIAGDISDEFYGRLRSFLGLQTSRLKDTMETQKPLLKDEDGEEVDVHMYRSMIGSLMNLTSSRHDIMFAVCACARYQVNPKVSHLYAVKRIFRYLKGQPKLGLWYPKDSPFDLVAYTNSDYAGASLDRKSTTRGKAKKSVKLMMEKLFGMELELMLMTRSGGPRCQKTIGDTIAQTRFENVSKHSMIHCSQEKLEKKDMLRSHKLKRLYKVGLSDRVESSGDKDNLGEDASKQGRRINDIDADDDITLVNVQDDADNEMFDADVLDGEEVFVANKENDEVNVVKDAAQVNVVGNVVSMVVLQQLLDKGKGIMMEPEKPMKMKDQISFDEETALKLQAEFDKEERLAREKAEKEQEANIALIETWDDIQAKIDADHQLAELSVEELSVEEKAKLFQ